jgi:adenylate kinase family enzyme
VKRDLPQRVWVLGPAGAGKTTLAHELSAQLGVPHVQLDNLFWGPGWSRTSEEDFVTGVTEVTAGPAWVVDGEYEAAQLVMAHRAQTALWLDLPLRTTLVRLARRSWDDFRTGRGLCNDNRQTAAGAVALMTWAARVDASVRRRNARLGEDYPTLRIVRFTSAPDGAAVLRTLQRSAAGTADLEREDTVHG